MSKIQKRSKYNNARKFTKSSIDINLKGFLCSCNNREKECIREAYNILNKYADLLYPLQPQNNQIQENSELNIEDELQNEISQIKTYKQRFQQVESGAKNFLFIKTTLDDPVKLVQTIVTELKNNGEQQTRFLIRLIPIEVTCKAYIKDIAVAFKVLAERYFKNSATTFSVVYNHRNNNSVDRDEIIKTIADLVFEANPNNKVDLKLANVSVIVEIVKGIALIGVVPDFIKYKKYNLLSITEKDETKVEDKMEQEGTEEKVKEEKVLEGTINKDEEIKQDEII